MELRIGAIETLNFLNDNRRGTIAEILPIPSLAGLPFGDSSKSPGG